MKYIHDESELHERGARIAALLPQLRDRPDKSRSKQVLIEYTRLLNQELTKAHNAPEMPTIRDRIRADDRKDRIMKNRRKATIPGPGDNLEEIDI